MSLRDRAIAAHDQADADLRARAVQALEVVGVHLSRDKVKLTGPERVDGAVRFLASDGDLTFAVRVLENGADVHLLDADGSTVGPVRSLADLGRLLTDR
jgi:hypothetical protein